MEKANVIDLLGMSAPDTEVQVKSRIHRVDLEGVVMDIIRDIRVSDVGGSTEYLIELGRNEIII